MINKTQLAKNEWLNGDKKKALQLMKNWRLGLTNEERRTIQICCDVETGRGSFYKQIGTDIEEHNTKLKIIVKKLFNL